MASPQTIDVLNRLLVIEYRSFPMYLADASPWVGPGDEAAQTALNNIVTDQRAMSQRIADMILDLGGQIDMGCFPMDFTDMQLLSLEFLLHKLAELQRRDVAAIEQCVAALREPAPRALAEECLGAERAHLEALEALLSEPVKS